MNKLTLVSLSALALLATGGPARAHDLDLHPDLAPAGTRALVIAELAAARASGELTALHGEFGIEAAGHATPLRFAPSSAGLPAPVHSASSAEVSLPRLAARSDDAMTRGELVAGLARVRSGAARLALDPLTPVSDLTVQPIGSTTPRGMTLAGP